MHLQCCLFQSFAALSVVDKQIELCIGALEADVTLKVAFNDANSIAGESARNLAFNLLGNARLGRGILASYLNDF